MITESEAALLADRGSDHLRSEARNATRSGDRAWFVVVAGDRNAVRSREERRHGSTGVGPVVEDRGCELGDVHRELIAPALGRSEAALHFDQRLDVATHSFGTRKSSRTHGGGNARTRPLLIMIFLHQQDYP